MVRVYRRRKYAKRSKLGRRRAVMMGRSKVAPGRLLANPNVHRFKETCQIASLSVTPGFSAGIINFKITDLENWPSFRQLFDLYKLTGVKLKIIPKMNVSEATIVNPNSQMGNLPTLYIASNRDPYVPQPATVGDILNDDGVKIIRLTRPINLWLSSPKVDLLDSAGQTVALQFGTSKAFQPWLTTGGNAQLIDQSNLAHYGFRWGATNPSATEAVLDVYATYYFALKEQD